MSAIGLIIVSTLILATLKVIVIILTSDSNRY